MIPGEGDLNALPTNFRLNSLLDVLAIKECNTSASSVEIATKEAEKATTASNVALSGVMTASVCIMASEPIKNITHWL